MARKILVLAALIAFGAGLMALTPAEINDMVSKADGLEAAGKYEESNKILMDVGKADPNNKQAYWMIARNFFDIGEIVPESNEKLKLDDYIKTEEWARKGLEKDPNLAENYFYVAVGMSQQALVKGIAVSLGKAKGIEEYYMKTLAMHPTYKGAKDSTEANASFALCQFYRKVPESSIMKLLFGTKGDMDKAVKYCGDAVKLYPNKIEFNKEMGMVLVCRGNRRNVPADVEAGKKWLSKTQAMAPLTGLDKIDIADSKKVLDSPKLACGYSRVKQEEVTDVKK
jgi:tetratricopeptide (TPR) repeat protein